MKKNYRRGERNLCNFLKKPEKKKKIQDFNGVWTGAPNENIVQNHLNIELLNVF